MKKNIVFSNCDYSFGNNCKLQSLESKAIYSDTYP